jgi:hypothetical protein
MDLKQRKLSKSEWESIEVPVSADEVEVLNLIMRGFSDVTLKYNKHNSLLTYLKIEKSDEMEDYLYNTYFAGKICELIKKYSASFMNISVNPKTKIKKADMIRLEKNSVATIEASKIVLYEYVLINLIENLLKLKKSNGNWEYYYFTIYKLIRNSVINMNRHIVQIVKQILAMYEDDVDMSKIVENSVDYIEKNDNILKYSDMMLYDHQKELFTCCKSAMPKLVLYIAPTGTGKTLSPLGLSESKRIIFVCAARHVGLALARAAISVNKKIAFAFGCSSAEEIRLHYFAAKEYTKNWRTGGIWKVDNSVGDKVEIMICDIKSYIPSMYYMLAFNKKEDIITYWDEPTITLDYDEHEFHEIIKKNWSENVIPNMVLSSATLPKVHEIPETISDFMIKFPEANIVSVISHDCKKTIPIVDNNGYVVLPHHMAAGYATMREMVVHCENYLTLLRYFDLKELVKFVTYVLQNNLVPANVKIERHFGSLDEIDMKTIKLYYLKLLKNIKEVDWSLVYDHFRENREKRIKPNDYIDNKGIKIKKHTSLGPGASAAEKKAPIQVGGGQLTRTMSVQTPVAAQMQISKPSDTGSCAIYITTKDSHTLTDGPTIFLANDIEKVAKFCIQQAAIPAAMMTDITDKIDFNNSVNAKMSKLEKMLEDIQERLEAKEVTDISHADKGALSGKKKKSDHKMNRSESENGSYSETRKVMQELEILRSMIKTASLNETFVPNSSSHLTKWADEMNVKNAFTSTIEDETILKIMMLEDVENSWKVLLLMGIGVFTNHESIAYTEIMKSLADQQKLYVIIASSDYIYGTNYQFCHGYLSKDMNLTQEKIIQAMGRIGRNKIQQDYSVRFRDDEQIKKLFSTESDKPEVRNMNRLFVTSE